MTQEQVKKLLDLLSFEAAELVVEDDTDKGVKIKITVPEAESGMLIGYHGEKIDALQLIISLIWNQNSIAYNPVQVDVNGYRERREKSLWELADHAVEKAIESGREILLPPLPSHERRVIHLYLQDHLSVETYSEGEAGDRRLVVRPLLEGESKGDH